MEPFRPPPLPPAPANPFSAPPPPPLHQQAESAPPPPHQQAGSAPPPATLLVRHLPEAITQEMLSRLFSHYGATAVRPCTGKLRNCAFVDFRDEMAANQAQSLLNRYAYPPPDGNILTNIVNSLIAVPRFYTQVLHLMNKMNLPAPFRMALPTPPLPSEVPAPPPPPPQPSTAEKLHLADLSSDESEMESSDEDVDRKIKRAKHEAIVGPAVDKSIAHEAVGVKPAALVSNELQVIKKKNPVMQIKITPRPASKELADQRTIDKELASRDEQLEQKHFATPQEIEKEKLPTEEILSLPMFKNYTPGNPASVLYIKNLAKDVVHDDFYYVFGSVFESMDAARSGLIIKLMQEGRMRGQAFVTFPSVELAQHALSLAHGYAFKGKPMIIQFGRNPAASKAS
ncbi:U11/U12 small nuclear ribonucleoprotein 65 kDa protein-like isoform X3 [Lolium rigidum]|uniref:U11/U12 small nuclear ribonucleoprotein 65 kDa protein-like isoform X3 n=1 Tax=Lolium rigidum TaxID=89674 RepID=UPI001F5DE6B4|nr:U11/U12 small nuclear ribonucleoprotein 65 kDa protein-like isoform X3 [Lolium rigidum]